MAELILGIESSCDETAAALVRGGREELASVVHSQVAEHAKWGGVVPELASRSHLDQALPVYRVLYRRNTTPPPSVADLEQHWERVDNPAENTPTP